MSRKAPTQTKPAPQVTQPPAKNVPATSKSQIKEAPKTATKGSFDVSPFTKAGFPEEVVLEIKTAFDLFDTDQGGSIDTRGKLYHLFKNSKPLWSHSDLTPKTIQFSK